MNTKSKSSRPALSKQEKNKADLDHLQSTFGKKLGRELYIADHAMTILVGVGAFVTVLVGIVVAVAILVRQ